MIQEILRSAAQAKASDVHIHVGAPPLFRIHTIMQPSDFPVMDPEGVVRLARMMMNEKRWTDFLERRDSDYSYEVSVVGRFRVNAHFQRNSVALSIRLVNDHVPPLDELYLPEIVTKLTHLPR